MTKRCKLLAKVDVLMPFHRLDDFFMEAIQSVLKSEGVQINLILLDNRRGERPHLDLDSVYRSFEENSHTIERKLVSYPLTYANALNCGLKYCTNQYIAIMNSDDLVTPDRFFLQSQSLEKNNGEISICSLQKFSGKRELPSMLGKLNLEYYSWLYLLLGAYGADASLMFKKSWIDDGSKIFPETQHSDWLFALQNYPNARIVAIARPLYYYRIHHSQITNSSETHKMETALADFLLLRLESLGIKLEDHEVLKALTAPFLRVKLRGDQVRVLQDICSTFLQNFDKQLQRKNLRKVLARRILFSFKNPLQISRIEIQWWLPIMKEFLQILIDFMIGRISLRSSRSA